MEVLDNSHKFELNDEAICRDFLNLHLSHLRFLSTSVLIQSEHDN